MGFSLKVNNLLKDVAANPKQTYIKALNTRVNKL